MEATSETTFPPQMSAILKITFLIPTIRGVMGDVDFFGHDATVLRREVVGTFSFGINKACCALDGPRSTDPPAARISP
jgi:hypothetical protein